MAAVSSGLLPLRELVGACVHLARRGGRIIKEVHAQGDFGAHNKKAAGDSRDAATLEPAEVLTIADTRCQDAIVTSLRSMFPGIRIVGEEDASPSHGELPTRLEEVQPLPVPFDVPDLLAQQLSLVDTCLWIDPLDGTIEFVRNNVHNVTVLIGICVRDRPVAGIIHQPFVGGEDGIVTYGAVGVGVFGDREPAFSSAPPSSLRLAMEPKDVTDPRVQAAVSRLPDAGDPLVSQACGQNLLKVLRGETSAFMQAPGASRWDICAGEALLTTVGGKLTDLDGRPYTYKEGESSYLNAEGVIAACTEAVHDRVSKAFAEEPEERAAKRSKIE